MTESKWNDLVIEKILSKEIYNEKELEDFVMNNISTKIKDGSLINQELIEFLDNYSFGCLRDRFKNIIDNFENQ